MCVCSPRWPRSSVHPPAALEEQGVSYSSFTSLAPLVRRYVAKAFKKICVAPLIYWYLSLFYVILVKNLLLCFVKSVLDFIRFSAAVKEAVKEQHGTPLPCSLCLLLLIFYFIYSLF